MKVSVFWKPDLALSLVSTAWSGAGWRGVGAPAALTPVVGALDRLSPQQLAAAAATGASQERKDLSARPSHLTLPLPPLPPPSSSLSSNSSSLPYSSSCYSSLPFAAASSLSLQLGCGTLVPGALCTALARGAGSRARVRGAGPGWR